MARKNALTGVSKERIEEIMAKKPKEMNAEEHRIYKQVLFEEWNGRGRIHARQSYNDFKKWSNDFSKYGDPSNYRIIENQTIQISTQENPEIENIAEVTIKPEYYWRSNNIKKVVKQVESVIEGNYEDDIVQEFLTKAKDIDDLNEVIEIAKIYVDVKDLRIKKNIEDSAVSITEQTESTEQTEPESVVL